VLEAVAKATGERRLCLASGCAMNSVANGRIRAATPFDEVFVQPAAADHGTALGAAFFVEHQVLGRPRSFVMEHACWGPAFDDEAIASAIEARQADIRAGQCDVRRFETRRELNEWTAARIAEGLVIGWFQGRM